MMNEPTIQARPCFKSLKPLLYTIFLYNKNPRPNLMSEDSHDTVSRETKQEQNYAAALYSTCSSASAF
jgi:hypothetical protein